MDFSFHGFLVTELENKFDTYIIDFLHRVETSDAGGRFRVEIIHACDCEQVGAADIEPDGGDARVFERFRFQRVGDFQVAQAQVGSVVEPERRERILVEERGRRNVVGQNARIGDLLSGEIPLFGPAAHVPFLGAPGVIQRADGALFQVERDVCGSL